MRILFYLLYPLNFLLFFPFYLLSRVVSTGKRASGQWLIGGHRGRIYEDNSAALHRYIAEESNQPITWIAGNRQLQKKLQSRGYRVLRKNSFSARWALLKAAVLIYSHGEDDLDQFFKWLRGRSGFRVYLGHSHHLVKGVSLISPEAEKWGERERNRYFQTRTDYDLILTGSPLEMEFRNLSDPHLAEKALPYGGMAHVDAILPLRQKTPSNRLLWFPTWRERKSEEEGLLKMIEQVTTHPQLLDWLQQQQLRLAVVSHINSPTSRALRSDSLVTFHPPQQIVELMAHAACLITDYSSILVDWLLLDRPLIHFVFDIEPFRNYRSFFITPEEFAFGPLIYTQQELIDLLTSERWREMAPYAASRASWKQKIFPNLECWGDVSFSERGYQTICDEQQKWLAR